MASMTKIFHRQPYDLISPTHPSNSQKGRTVFITGGSSGIGFEIAKGFLQARASRIILLGRRATVLEQAKTQLLAEPYASTTEILLETCDMNDGLGMKLIWDRLAASSIHVDILILNAAITPFGPVEPLMDFLIQMNTAFEMNVFANARVAGYFLAQQPAKPERPQTLINISSFMAHSNPAPMQAAYASSKGAFAHILQLLADEVSPERCTIVNVHPGAVETEAVSGMSKEARDAVAWDEPSLPGAFAVWASTPAARFLHGRFVWANWDAGELMGRERKFDDPGYLKLGIQGAEHVDIRTIMDKIRGKESDQERF